MLNVTSLFDPEVASRALNRRRFTSTLKRYTIEGLFEPNTGNISLNKNLIEEIEKLHKSGIDTNDLWEAATSSLETFNAYLTFVHEQTHWYQSIGTPYGQLNIGFDSALYNLLTSTCKKVREKWPEVPIKKPLFQFASSSIDDLLNDRLSEANTYIATQAITGLAGQLLWDYLEGNNVVLSSYAATIMCTYAGIFNDAEICVKYWESVCNEEFKRKISSSPIGLDGKFIGGKDLLEGQARAVEEIHKITAKLGSNLKGISLFEKSKWFGDYSRAFDFFLNSKGLTRDSKLKDMEWLNLLLKFCALCDIAMFTPIDPGYRHLWKESMDWQDFHPGWRFCILVEKVEPSLNKTLPEWGIYCENIYSNLSDSICESLGWPKISEFVSIRRSKDPKMTHIQVLDEAMNVRRQFPSAFIAFGCLQSASEEAYKLMDQSCSPPMIFSLDGSFWGGIGKKTENNLLEKAPFYLASLLFDISLQLMFEKGYFHTGNLSGFISLMDKNEKREFFEAGLNKHFLVNCSPKIEILT